MYKLINPTTGKLEYFDGEKPKKTRKPIRQISDKKKSRLSTRSEKDVFLEVWNERHHNCEKCGKYLPIMKAHMFDHIIPKSRGEAYRLDKNNISLVCFSCHFLKTTGLVYKGPDLDI